MSERNKWSKGWRGVLLIALGVVMGANLITPAVAHVTESVTHLFSHTDQRYYKKSQVNAISKAVGKQRDWVQAGTPELSTATKALETTLGAPQAGFALVNYTVGAYNNEGAVADVVAWVEKDQAADFMAGGQFAPGRILGSLVVAQVPEVYPFYETVSGSVMVRVAKGSRQFTLCVDTDEGQIGLVDASLNAAFFKTGSATTVTAPEATVAERSSRVAGT